MQPDQSLSAYIFRETLIGGVINAFFSLIFVFIVFAGQATISMAGSDGLLIDSLPQGLAIGLLGSFFPSFLTRKRLSTGALPACSHQSRSRLPLQPFLRALLFAVLGAALTVVLFYSLFLVGKVTHLSFLQAAFIKVIWGGLLGAAVAHTALRLALRDYHYLHPSLTSGTP